MRGWLAAAGIAVTMLTMAAGAHAEIRASLKSSCFTQNPRIEQLGAPRD